MSVALDIVLAVLLIGVAVQGWRSGLLRSVGAIAGLAAGGIAAWLLSPVIGGLLPAGTPRAVGTVMAAVVLVLVGVAIGSRVGGLLGGVLHRTPVAVVDRTLGAAAQLVVAAAVVSVLASIALATAGPVVRGPEEGSVVLHAIDSATPAPVHGVLAQVESTVLSQHWTPVA